MTEDPNQGRGSALLRSGARGARGRCPGVDHPLRQADERIDELRALVAHVAPLLELIEAGAVVSPELLMTSDDIKLAQDLATDDESTEAEQAMIEQLLRESASQ